MAASEQLPLPIEIILTCSICQATIPEIYENRDSDKGFRDRSSDDDQEQTVTKLWLTECGHLTCGRHLAGGGVPFHPTGEQPQAACPYCMKEAGDHEKRALYGVRGWDEGMFDEAIPKNWFSSPPIQLGGEGEAMQAMRFQYLSLIRFGSNAHVRLRAQKQKQTQLDRVVKDSNSQCHELQNQINDLRQQLAESQKCEAALTVWKEREPKILYYLGVFDEVTRENTKLRDQLSAMGYAVPIRKWNNDVPPIEIRKKDIQDSARDAEDRPEHMPPTNAGTSIQLSRHADGPAAGGERLPKQLTEPMVPKSRSANKRKREAEEEIEEPPKKPYPALARQDSKKLMPPPPKPDRSRITSHSIHHGTEEVRSREGFGTQASQSLNEPSAQSISSKSNTNPTYQPHYLHRNSQSPQASHRVRHPERVRSRTPPTQPVPRDIPRKHGGFHHNSSDPLLLDSARPNTFSSRAEAVLADNPFRPEPMPLYTNEQSNHSHFPRYTNRNDSIRHQGSQRHTSGCSTNSQVVGYVPTPERAIPQRGPRGHDPSFQPPRRVSSTNYTTPMRPASYNHRSFSSPLRNTSQHPREAVTSPFFSCSPQRNQSGPVTFSARSKATSHILSSGDVLNEATSHRFPYRSHGNRSSRDTYELPVPPQSPRTYTPATPSRPFGTGDSNRDVNGLFRRPDHPQQYPHAVTDSYSHGIIFHDMPPSTPSARTSYYHMEDDQHYKYRDAFTADHHAHTSLPPLRNGTSWQPRKIPQRHQDLDLNAILEGGVPDGAVVGRPARR